MINLRVIAAHVIEEVTDGRSLSDSLEMALTSIKDPRDAAFVQAVCYGVCRFYTRLDVMLSHLLQKPLKEKDSDVHALLLVGLYQLWAMRIPDYAVVTETVNAIEKFKKPWARALVNAILRNYLRQRDAIEKQIENDPEAVYAHPQWWIDKIKAAWPLQWQEIFKANNAHPVFALRVNQRMLTRDNYLEKLQQAGHAAHLISATQNGIILEKPISAEELPGFAAGEVSVQDGAAQLAAEWLDIKPEQRVLDACAAPGGKLTHLLEIEPHLGSVIAVEKEASRLSSIKANLKRLNLQAECICADASAVNEWWDKQLFDRILLDAPCSASGVIRRHPDIKLLRQPTDIKVLAKQQLHLLTQLWPLLKVNGLFLYATCSIFPEENVQVLQQFLASHPDAKEEKIRLEVGFACDVGWQILPGMGDMDGFYYALILKV
jgi:16S rRNA (cytosine967-C5)-methyltransferase